MNPLRAASARWRRSTSMGWGRTDGGLALKVFLTNKVIVVLVAGVAAWGGAHPAFSRGFAYEVLVRSFRYYDAGWYARIASDGYVDIKETAFFPLYPMLMRGLSELTGLSPLAAGVLISNLAFYGLLYAFVKLARLDLDASAARRATWLLGLFPTSFYFSAAYTEALYALLAAVALHGMITHRWARAGVAGGLAALTRNTGVLLVLPYLIEFASSLGGARGRLGGGMRLLWARKSRRRLAGVLWAGLIAAGALGYVLFLWQRFGRPLAFADTQPLFGRETMPPWSTLYHGFGHALKTMLDLGWPPTWWDFYVATELLFVTLVIVVLVGTFGRIRWSYWVIMLYSLAIPLAAPSTEGVVDYFISFSRYSLVILPLHIGLARLLRRDRLYRGYLAVSLLLLVVFLYAWSRHTWVA